MTDLRALPNPFLVTEADVLLDLLERRLAGDLPLFRNSPFLARLEAAVLAASAEDPARHARGMRIVARLRELAPR